jgi:hypothetical protein
MRVRFLDVLKFLEQKNTLVKNRINGSRNQRRGNERKQWRG